MRNVIPGLYMAWPRSRCFFTGACFYLFRHELPALYSDDEAVLTLAAATLPIAAAFQLFDGIQVVGGGILRGQGNSRPAAIFNFVAYYLIALPVGYVFAFDLKEGIAGLWWALCLGLALIAVMFLIWNALRGPAHIGLIQEHRRKKR